MIGVAAETAWYVYGVVQATGSDPARAAAARVRAVGGGTDVRLVTHGALAAIVSEVPLAEFEETALPELLNDRAWLETNARAHEEVLQSVARAGPVVPFRFGTIYRSVDDVQMLLESNLDAFTASLDRVRGCVEIGVKAWLDSATFESSRAADVTSRSGSPGSGRAYLQQRRDDRQRADEAAALTAEIARAAHEQLLRVAVDGVVNRPQPRELTGRSDDMLLNAAYLVRASDDRILAEVERLNAEHGGHGVVFELTGPWPPHNFVDDGAGT